MNKVQGSITLHFTKGPTVRSMPLRIVYAQDTCWVRMSDYFEALGYRGNSTHITSPAEVDGARYHPYKYDNQERTATFVRIEDTHFFKFKHSKGKELQTVLDNWLGNELYNWKPTTDGHLEEETVEHDQMFDLPDMDKDEIYLSKPPELIDDEPPCELDPEEALLASIQDDLTADLKVVTEEYIMSDSTDNVLPEKNEDAVQDTLKQIIETLTESARRQVEMAYRIEFLESRIRELDSQMDQVAPINMSQLQELASRPGFVYIHNPK